MTGFPLFPEIRIVYPSRNTVERVALTSLAGYSSSTRLRFETMCVAVP